MAPDFVLRHEEIRRKKEEDQRLKDEEQKAIGLLRSKQLDVNRLKELCQPRKQEVSIKSPEKPKPILSEAQIQRQQESIARLSKGYKKPETQKVLTALKDKISKDKKQKEDKEKKRRMNLANNSKVLAIT